MKSVITMFCLITQVTIALGAPPATTQPSRGSGQGATAVFEPNYEPIVFKLEHANSFEVARTLAGAFSACSSIPVEQSNSVIFVGPPESQTMARKLVGEMDSVATQHDGPQIVVFPVQHRRVDELVEHLIRVGEGRRLRASGDRARSKVLLRGDAEDIKQAEALLKELDTAASGVSIEFAFLQAKSGGAVANSPMPADLADIAKELERFGQVTLLGRLSTVAVEGEKFSVEGQVVPGITAEVRGFVSNVNQEGIVKADLKASLRLLPAQVADSKDHLPAAYFNLETVVTTQRGDYLVLGSAPAGSQIGESAILVMHVRK